MNKSIMKFFYIAHNFTTQILWLSVAYFLGELVYNWHYVQLFYMVKITQKGFCPAFFTSN